LIRERAVLTSEVKDLRRKLNILEAKLSKVANLVPGRLFLDHRGRMYCALQSHVRREEQGVLACRVKAKIPFRGQHVKMRWFRPQKVAHILDRVLDLPPLDDPQGIKALMARIAQEDLPPVLESLPQGKKEVPELRPMRTRALFLEQALNGLICKQCRHFKQCHGKPRGAFRHVLDSFSMMWDSAHAVRLGLWNDFVKHLDFLKGEGFVTEGNRLTSDGVWASQLRLDQPLMIAEGLRTGILPDSDPALLGALVAPFVHDRDVEERLDEATVPKRLLNAFHKMIKALTPLMERKVMGGFEARPIVLWPAATIYAWANGQPWEKVLEIGGMAEGDLAMLVTRTADNLRQIASLTKVYPAIARSALDAIDMILREPVAFD
jgi:ATP-dependent RNA helicase HelY